MDEEYRMPKTPVTKLSPVDHYLAGSWEALGAGAPVLVALAQLCSQAMVDGVAAKPTSVEGMMPEAKAILVAARGRGVIEVRGVNTAFDPAARMLAVYVEIDETQTIAFRDPNEPEVTVRFLEGFRQLCALGLVMHHLHRDFSLSTAGFELAKLIQRDDVLAWLEKGSEFGLHD
jgi:hypothetical protein